jgi:hypothetical protein
MQTAEQSFALNSVSLRALHRGPVSDLSKSMFVHFVLPSAQKKDRLGGLFIKAGRD